MVVVPTPGPRPTPKDLAARPTVTVDELDRVMSELISELEHVAKLSHPTAPSNRWGGDGDDTGPFDSGVSSTGCTTIADDLAARTEIIRRAHEYLSAALSGSPLPAATRSDQQ